MRALPFMAGLALVVLGLVPVAAQDPGLPTEPDPNLSPIPDIPTVETPSPTRTPTVTPTPTPRPSKYTGVAPALAADRNRVIPAGIDAIECQPPINGGDKPGSDVTKTMLSGGRTRTYHVHLPASTPQDRRYPVVLNFHGLGSNPELQQCLSGLSSIADREAFILVSPLGLGEVPGWKALLNEERDVEDVQFIADLIQVLFAEYRIDVDRIYATGFSNGAMMASRAACRLGVRIAAIAPVAGVYDPGAGCTRAMPVLAVHGTADDVVPFGPGQVLGVPYAGAVSAVQGWAARMAPGCGRPPEREQLAPNVTIERYRHCNESTDTALVIVEGGGHNWAPGFELSELIWQFFADHALK